MAVAWMRSSMAYVLVGWAKRSVPTILSADQDGGHGASAPLPTRRILPRQILQQQIQRRARKRLHVGLPVGAAGLQRDHRVLRARDRHAAVAGGVAVAVAGRAGGAGFRKAPVGGKALRGSGSPAVLRRARTPSECPSSHRRECPSASAARRGYRPPRRRGNRRRRRAPRAAPPRSGRRSRIPRPRWSASARSVWRRSFRRSGQGLSFGSQFLRVICSRVLAFLAQDCMAADSKPLAAADGRGVRAAYAARDAASQREFERATSEEETRGHDVTDRGRRGLRSASRRSSSDQPVALPQRLLARPGDDARHDRSGLAILSDQFADLVAAGLAAGAGQAGLKPRRHADAGARPFRRQPTASAIRCTACRWCFPRTWRMRSAAR